MADFVEYTNEVEAQLMDWDGRVAFLRDKGVDAQIVQDLGQKRDDVRHKLNALQKESRDWQKLVPDLDVMRGQVQKEFEEASLKAAR